MSTIVCTVGNLNGNHARIFTGWSQPIPGQAQGTNSLIQAAKRRARGYRSKAKMITIIYLIAGKLPLPQIHTI